MTEMQQFKLPDVGEGLTEAEIITWMVKPGDEVKVNEILVEIETAKSLVELPSPYAGTIARLLAPEGETVAVGTPIIEIAPPGMTVPDEPAAPSGEVTGGTEMAGEADPYMHLTKRPGVSDSGESDSAGAETGAGDGEEHKTLVGYGPRTAGTKRRPRKASATGTAAGTVVPQSTAAATAQADVNSAFSTAEEVAPALEPDEAEELTPATGGRPATPHAARARALAKPPVRKLAKDLGVDLLTVTPSGEGGVVTRDDVQAHAGRHTGGGPGPADGMTSGRAAAGGETRVPIKGVRKMTAEAMVSSAFTAPHVTEWVTVDVTRTMELVERLRADRAFADVRVSPLLVVAKAVCLALRRTPEVNATWDDAAQEIVLKDYVNLGIAAATPRGLVVPNIVGAESMSLHALATALGELVGTARDGRTQPAEMSGGTFTITNVGVFGVDAGTPILNPGEAGILAFGAVNRRPWVVASADGDEIVPRWVTTLALSFDHRVVDGEQGSRFLADVAALLEDPATALLY